VSDCVAVYTNETEGDRKRTGREARQIARTERLSPDAPANITWADVKTWPREIYVWVVETIGLLTTPNLMYLIPILPLLSVIVDYERQFRFLRAQNRAEKAEVANEFLAAAISGSFLAFFVCGIGGDYLAAYITRRNGKFREPEHQLPNFILPIITGFISIVLTGFEEPGQLRSTLSGIQAGNVLGSFSYTAFRFISLTYALECYPTFAGTVISLLPSVRALLSIPLNEGLVQLFTKTNIELGSGIWSAIFSGFALLILPLGIFGKRIRRSTGRWTKRNEAALVT